MQEFKIKKRKKERKSYEKKMEYSNYIFNHFLVTEETAKSIQQWPSRPEFSIALLKQLTKV